MTRASNSLLNIAEFVSGTLELQSKPRFLIVELTRNCNLYCLMCREKLIYEPRAFMSFELFTCIASELFTCAEVIDLRGWGESTLVPEFNRYVELAATYDAQLRLYSNLTKRDDRIWDLLAEVQCYVGISFDGGTKETFERIRRGARFESVIANIQRLADQSRYHHGTSGNLCLSTVVQGLNVHELPLIIQWAHRLGIGLVKLFPIICPVDSFNHLCHHRPVLNNALLSAAELAERHGIRLEMGAALNESFIIPTKVIPMCPHPWMYCHITPEGKIGFCDHLIAFPEYLLGDLSTSSFMDTWNNEEFQQLRACHSDRRTVTSCFGACRWCYSYRYDDSEHQIYPPYYDNIVTVREALEQQADEDAEYSWSNE